MLGPIYTTSHFAAPSPASAAGFSGRATAEKERWTQMEFILEQTAKRKGGLGVTSSPSPRSPPSSTPLRPHHQHRRHQSEDYRPIQLKQRASPPASTPNPALLDSTTLYSSSSSLRSSSGQAHHAGMMVAPSTRTAPTTQPSTTLSKTITPVHSGTPSTAAITGTTHTDLKLKEAGTASLGSTNAFTRGPAASTTTPSMGIGSAAAPFSSGFGSHQHQQQALSSKASGARHIGHRQTKSASGLNMASLGSMPSPGTLAPPSSSSVLYQAVPVPLASGKGGNNKSVKQAPTDEDDEPFLFYSSDGKLPKGIAVPTGMSLVPAPANTNARQTVGPSLVAPVPMNPVPALPPSVVNATRRNMHKRSQSSLDSIPEEE